MHCGGTLPSLWLHPMRSSVTFPTKRIRLILFFLLHLIWQLIHCNIIVLRQYCIDTTIFISFANAPEEDSLDPIPQSRPKGSITLVDIVGDNLYMIDSTSSIHSLSLDYPSLKFRMLAMSKQVDKALEWVSFIPEDLHDYLAEFLVERGFAVEAVKHMVAMNASKRFNLCLQYKLCQEGYISLQALDLKRGRDHKQRMFYLLKYEPFIFAVKDGKVCKLYIRLATICVLQQENDLAQKCYIRASELSDSYVEAIVKQ